MIPQQSHLKKESEYSQNKVKGINIAYLKAFGPMLYVLFLPPSIIKTNNANSFI